jgi:hypothetical protein
MNQRKTLMSLLAAPACFLIISIGLELWFSAQLRDRGPSQQAVCSATRLSQPTQDLCDSRNLAIIALCLSASLVALSVIAFGAVTLINRWTRTGMIGFEAGCRFGYQTSILTSVTLCLGTNGILFPLCGQLLIMRAFGTYWPDFDIFMISILFMMTVAGMVITLKGTRLDPESVPIRVSAQATTAQNQPDLFAVLERLASSLKCPTPRHVLAGLDPAIFCTQQTVFVEDTPYQGGTLFLSLPLCRLLSEGEMASMIATELIASQMVTPGWVGWQTAKAQKYERIRMRFQQGPIPIGSLFSLVWIWLDTWSNWRMSAQLLALQRATISGGRENTASGFVKTLLYAPQWPKFLTHVQNQLRAGGATDINSADQSNMSLAFVNYVGALSDQFQEILQGGPPALDEEIAAHFWILALGANSAEVATRIENLPKHPAAEWIAGIETIERELSTAQIERIFFLRASTPGGS